jgi:prolipoprotein diacylglyceryl transferase
MGLGTITIHYYALCILLGIATAIWIGKVRYVRAGGIGNEIYDLAIYVVPAGIIGGRLYHVVTTPELYFGARGNFSDVFKIWQGGMGIWGAIALGVAAGYVYFKHKLHSQSFLVALDALTPGIVLAQGIGRWGNWFNGELFGKPTTLPWGLKIPEGNRPVRFESFATFHPTFLYESILCLLITLLVIYLPWARTLRDGNQFLLYVFLYCSGRLWIESLRIDTAHHIFGIRLNIWIAGICAIASAGGLYIRQKRLGAGTANQRIAR